MLTLEYQRNVYGRHQRHLFSSGSQCPYLGHLLFHCRTLYSVGVLRLFLCLASQRNYSSMGVLLWICLNVFLFVCNYSGTIVIMSNASNGKNKKRAWLRERVASKAARPIGSSSRNVFPSVSTSFSFFSLPFQSFLLFIPVCINNIINIPLSYYQTFLYRY